MTIWNYLFKSIRYYRKQHLAVFAASLLGTAVLTGALIVGDSVKLSLQNLVEARLGKTQVAMSTADRFVRSALADEIKRETGAHTVALLQNQGLAINPENDLRLENTRVFGVDDGFWDLGSSRPPQPENDEVVVSASVLEYLNLNIGDVLLMRMPKEGAIPLNAPFVSHEEVSISMRLKIVAVAGEDQMGRFSLQSNQAEVYNVFVSRDFLAKKLDLSLDANLILSEYNDAEKLNKLLPPHMQKADYGLKLTEMANMAAIEVTSDRIFIDASLSKGLLELPFPSKGILTYLVNSIRSEQGETPYSFVAAIDQGIIDFELKEDDIIVNQWLAEDLHIQPGDSISLSYYVVGPMRRLSEVKRVFYVTAIVGIETDKLNRSLMPAFPGLADAGSCTDWEAGIPIDLSRIRDKDEKYWDDYKGTPKAYINLKQGQELWKNPFGDYTALWLETNAMDSDELRQEIRKTLHPSDINLSFHSVRKSGMQAAGNGVDFGELFLSLSFFVIAAAVLLIVLIQALNIESRGKEAGILMGLGFSQKQLLRLRFLESFGSIVPGAIIGACIGILYNYGLLYGLNSVWRDAVQTSQLQVFVLPQTLFVGMVSGMLLSMVAVFMASRRNKSLTVKERIYNSASSSAKPWKLKKSIVLMVVLLSFFAAISLMAYSIISAVDQNSGLFLGAAALFMLATVGMIWLAINRWETNKSAKNLSLSQLAFINLGRNPGRSLTVIVLLALGTFTTIITGANRKTFFGSETQRSSGTGGYGFWAESSIPILFDLNTESGRENLGLGGDALIQQTQFMQFHLLDGDDASCLNLNQVQNPKILGVDQHALNQRQSFSFEKLLDGIDAENPWLALSIDYGADVIPAFADQTVITWGLIKKLGDTLYYTNEAGENLKVLLIGGLKASVFQGHLLIADHQFSKHFPSVAGSRTMLVDGPADRAAELSETLEQSFVDYGFTMESSTHRLAVFNSVTNTYLSVFMFLGGLGVLLGTIGLGIVLIRNLLDRRSEIAVLQALGFSERALFKLIFRENLLLLIGGILIGVFAALIGIMPSLLSSSLAVTDFGFLLWILIIFISGLLWIYFPLRSGLKKDMISGLRSE